MREPKFIDAGNGWEYWPGTDQAYDPGAGLLYYMPDYAEETPLHVRHVRADWTAKAKGMYSVDG